MEKDLSKINLITGETAEEWLQTQPEEWRQIETLAIYICRRWSWSLSDRNIQAIAKAINDSKIDAEFELSVIIDKQTPQEPIELFADPFDVGFVDVKYIKAQHKLSEEEKKYLGL